MNEKDRELVNRVYQRAHERKDILRRAVADEQRKLRNLETLAEVCAIAEHMLRGTSVVIECGKDSVALHSTNPLHYKLREAILDYLSMED